MGDFSGRCRPHGESPATTDRQTAACQMELGVLALAQSRNRFLGDARYNRAFRSPHCHLIRLVPQRPKPRSLGREVQRGAVRELCAGPDGTRTTILSNGGGHTELAIWIDHRSRRCPFCPDGRWEGERSELQPGPTAEQRVPLRPRLHARRGPGACQIVR